MKFAEALILRADRQKRIEQLRERLVSSAKVQEGEKPRNVKVTTACWSAEPVRVGDNSATAKAVQLLQFFTDALLPQCN